MARRLNTPAARPNVGLSVRIDRYYLSIYLLSILSILSYLSYGGDKIQLSLAIPPPAASSPRRARRDRTTIWCRPAASLGFSFPVSRAKGASFGPLRGRRKPRRAAPARRFRLWRTTAPSEVSPIPNCTGHGITRVRRRGHVRPSVRLV